MYHQPVVELNDKKYMEKSGITQTICMKEVIVKRFGELYTLTDFNDSHIAEWTWSTLFLFCYFDSG